MDMREPIQTIEIDQKICSRAYGTAPCTAAIGVTGDDRCYNTFATCQDTQNYDETVLTLRFTQSKDHIEQPHIPSLLSVSSMPTTINAGGVKRDKKALGTRGSMSVTIQDHPHSDYFVDPYRTQRSYDPEASGTFWGKWLARNPYYRNTVIRVIDGYIGVGTTNTRTFIIDEINGPDAKGKVSIKSKDILSLADDQKAQAPDVSTGELIADITTTETTLRLQNALATDYPAPGHVRIGKEIMYFAATSTISAEEINLTGCIRTQKGTENNDHGAGDRVQFCLEYDDAAIADVMYDLLVNYGNVDPSFIDLAAWQEENEIWLSPFNVSVILSEPEGVTKLLQEISEQTLSYIWYDERLQEIRFRAVKPATEIPPVINQRDHILADSTKLYRKEDERFSQVWLFHGQRDPTKKLNDEANWLRLRVAVDSENPYQETQIKKIYGRWLQTEAQAGSIANRLLNRYRATPVYLELALDAKDGALWTGDLIDVSLDEIVDFSGQPETTRFQIMSAEEVESGHKISYKLINYVFFGRFAYWMAADAPDYDTATDLEKLNGLFWAGADGKLNGEDGYNWN